MLQLDKLRDWQVAPAQHLFSLLSAGKSCVDVSDCGTGKTYVAMACVAALKLPTLVCAPKISESQWHAAANHFGDSVSFCGHEMLRSGNSPYGRWERPLPAGADREYYQCSVCQCRVDLGTGFFPCHCNRTGIHCLSLKKKQHRYGKFIFSPAIKLLVIDEQHRFNSADSLNADMLIAAHRQRIPTLGLSATLGNSPLHFRAIGYCLGLHNLDHDEIRSVAPRVVRPSFRRWAARHKVRPDTALPGHPLRWWAGEAEQQQIMRDIRSEIIPTRGVRVAKAGIPDFPEVDISAELYDLEQSGKIQEAQAEMHDALATLAARKQLDVAPDSAITIMLRAHQQVELLKVPLAIELANNYVEQGYSIGIFVNFQQTVDALAGRLSNVGVVDGRNTQHRQTYVELFQHNISKILVVNSAAGGLALSLPDETGDNPRGGLVFPGWSAPVLQQVLGRFPRESSKSKSFYKVLLAAKTGDVAIHRALRLKLNNLDALLDSDLQPDNLSLTTGTA